MKFKAISNEKRELELNWKHINLYCSRWKPDTSFEVEIVRRVARRSDPLRRYYFGAVIKPLMKELGYEPHELDRFHEQLKIKYFNLKPDERGIYRNVPSVFSDESELPVPDKKEFTDWVVRIAAKYGVYIDDPS